MGANKSVVMINLENTKYHFLIIINNHEQKKIKRVFVFLFGEGGGGCVHIFCLFFPVIYLKIEIVLLL